MFGWFKKIKSNPKNTVEELSKRFIVGNWYVNTTGDFFRISNIFNKKGKAFITVEFPFFDGHFWSIVKVDYENPENLSDLTIVSDKDNKRLEKSYWKSIENELLSLTNLNKKSYKNFISFGDGYGNVRKTSKRK